MTAMLTSGGQLFRRIGSLLPTVNGKQPKCVQTYFYGGDEATKWRIKNTHKKIKNITEKKKYEQVFKMLHDILIRANNKYIKSFLGVKDYVETHLNDNVWDVKLSIHANESADSLVHAGRLNAPTVNEVAILLPDNDVITANHRRYITFNYRQKEGRRRPPRGWTGTTGSRRRRWRHARERSLHGHVGRRHPEGARRWRHARLRHRALDPPPQR